MSTNLSINQPSNAIPLATPTTSPKLLRQPASDEFLSRWLTENHLQHLYDKIYASHVSIIELAECDEKVIHETARSTFRLTDDDLFKFTKALMRHNDLQHLMKKSTQIMSYIENLEQSKNEIDIKHKQDILCIEQRFKNMMKALNKRQNNLVSQLNKSIEHKSSLLNKQLLNLKDHKQQIEDEYNVLLACDMTENRETLHENNNAQRLLKQNISFDKQRFANINCVSVEIANYDDMISRIKCTGIIIDEFDVQNDDHSSGYMDDTMNCLCGSQLVLTAIDAAYANNDVIFCNFCNSKCVIAYNSEIYHCPQGDVKLHPGGFDLCYFCGSKCLQSRKADRRKEREQRKRQQETNRLYVAQRKKEDANMKANTVKTYARIYRKIANTNSIPPRHKRSISAMRSKQWNRSMIDHRFLYSKQLKQLENMGYDRKNCAKLLIKYKGNMIKVVAELIT